MVPQYSNPIYDEEAERAVLGAMLEDNLAIPKVMAILGNNCEVFYRIPHQLIYTAILAVYEDKGVGDAVMVGEEIQRTSGLNRIGGGVYLYELVNSVPTSENAEYYAEIVKEKALRRTLIRAGKEIAASANKEEDNIDEIIDKAEQLIFDIGHSEDKRGFIHIRQVVKDSLKEIEEIFHNKRNLAGVPTGFVDFDILTMGLQPSDFIIIAGRPSVGKSVLAHNIAQYIGVKEQRPVAIFSLEMPKEHVCLRMLSAETQIEFHKLRMGKFSQDDWQWITSAATILGHAPIFINDTPGINVMEMRAEARRLMAEHEDLALIIIDYLQIMGGKFTDRYESSYERVTEISKSLKSLARELNVPVLALSQLSRSIERRGDPRPMLSDLRESGALEQDADLVAFIHREDYYDENAQEGLTELIIKKQRNGPQGAINLKFIKSQMRFETYGQKANI
jgi:replicative DNA helicase